MYNQIISQVDRILPGDPVQDSLGVLNQADTESVDENPQVDAAEPEETVSRFATIGRSIEDLPVAAISHFTLIPDFLHPTANDRPIVVRTPQGLFCIDGWNLIEEARNAEAETISCEVDTMAVHAEEELCLRKAAIRSATRGGKGEYLENARNARDLRIMLLSSNEDLRELGHGGQRRGEGSVANREDNVRVIVANRLGKDQDTVNTYIRHLEYLSNEAIQVFISRGAKKQLFEKAQKQKRNLLRTYTAEGTPEEEITQNVSSLLMGLFTRPAERRGSSRRPRTASASNQTLTFNVSDHPVEPVEHQGDEAHGDAENMEAQNPREDFEQNAPSGDDIEELLMDEEDADSDTGSVQTASSSIVEETDENVTEQLAQTYSVPRSRESVTYPTPKDSRLDEAEFVGEILHVLYDIAERYENLMPDISARELEGMLLETISMQQELVQHIQIFRKK